MGFFPNQKTSELLPRKKKSGEKWCICKLDPQKGFT